MALAYCKNCCKQIDECICPTSPEPIYGEIRLVLAKQIKKLRDNEYYEAADLLEEGLK